MAGDSVLKARGRLECNSLSPSNTVQGQPGSTKPDSTRWYADGYRPLTPSPIASSSTVPVEPSLDSPIKATRTFGDLSPASADFSRVAKYRRVSSLSGSLNAADGEITIPNTPRGSHSRLLVSTPELGKQPIADNRGRVSSPRPSGMSKHAEN